MTETIESVKAERDRMARHIVETASLRQALCSCGDRVVSCVEILAVETDVPSALLALCVEWRHLRARKGP